MKSARFGKFWCRSAGRCSGGLRCSMYVPLADAYGSLRYRSRFARSLNRSRSAPGSGCSEACQRGCSASPRAQRSRCPRPSGRGYSSGRAPAAGRASAAPAACSRLGQFWRYTTSPTVIAQFLTRVPSTMPQLSWLTRQTSYFCPEGSMCRLGKSPGKSRPFHDQQLTIVCLALRLSRTVV